MDFIKEWFMSITGVIVLAALMEGILPSGNIRKYVRILFGLILIIFVCKPFAKGKTDELKFDATSYEDYIEQGNIEEKEREAVLRL